MEIEKGMGEGGAGRVVFHPHGKASEIQLCALLLMHCRVELKKTPSFSVCAAFNFSRIIVCVHATLAAKHALE